MPEFIYIALQEDESETTGQIFAESVAAAVAQLEAAGLLLTSIHKVTDDQPEKTNSSTASKATIGEDQQALRQRIASVLEKRGILAPALAAFAEELPPGRSRRELRELVARLRSDASVEEICGSDDCVASWLLLLGRGTSSQRLLSDLFDEAMREDESQSQWNRAFIYPTIVFLGALGTLLFLCVTIVPAFKSIFDDFQLDLPKMTDWLVRFSSTIMRNPVGIALGSFALMGGVYILFHLIRLWGLPGRLIGLLFTGNSWQVTAVARFTRQLAEALDAGLELPAALRLAGGVGEQTTMRRLAQQLADEAEQKNFELNKSPLASRLPATLLHALQAESGNKPSIPLLRQLAELYTTRVRDRHNWSTGFMAQFAIVGIGLTVGFVVLALFIPLVELINGLTG